MHQSLNARQTDIIFHVRKVPPHPCRSSPGLQNYLYGQEDPKKHIHVTLFRLLQVNKYRSGEHVLLTDMLKVYHFR